jgi:cobalt-zinc-cadmium efflux system protein
LTDALHDLGDSVAIGISVYLQKVSEKETNDSFTFGFRRFSLLGALINALILIGGSTFMLTKSIPEIFDPSPTNGKGMLLLAILGVVVNGAAALKIKKGESVNQKMVYLHLLEDAAGWVATLVGAGIMIFFDLPVIDPLLSIIITVYILFQVISSLRGIFRIMLQGVPKNINLEDLRSKILKINGVEDILDFHYWSIDGENHIVTLHLIVSHDTSLKDQLKIKQGVRDVLTDKKTRHITIEFVSDPDDHDLKLIKH